MPTLNKCDFKSIHEYMGELSKYIAEETKGEVRLVSIVSDETGEVFTKTAIVGSGSKARLVNTLEKALENTKEKDDWSMDDELKDMMKKLFGSKEQ